MLTGPSTEQRKESYLDPYSSGDLQRSHQRLRLVLLLHQQCRPGIWRLHPYYSSGVRLDLNRSTAQVRTALSSGMLRDYGTGVLERPHEQEGTRPTSLLPSSLLTISRAYLWWAYFHCLSSASPSCDLQRTKMPSTRQCS